MAKLLADVSFMCVVLLALILTREVSQGEARTHPNVCPHPVFVGKVKSRPACVTLCKNTYGMRTFSEVVKMVDAHQKSLDQDFSLNLEQGLTLKHLLTCSCFVKKKNKACPYSYSDSPSRGSDASFNSAQNRWSPASDNSPPSRGSDAGVNSPERRVSRAGSVVGDSQLGPEE